MKQFIPLSAVLAGVAALLCIGNSCSKSSDSSTSGSGNNASGGTTAQATYDNQSGGIYKGTLTGSSGYFVVNLQAAKPYVIYQWTDPAGATDSLPAASLNNWQSGQAVSKALFTGASGAKFWFSVGTNGSNPVVDSVYFPNHSGPVYVTIVKETSVSPIKIYQGTGVPVSSNGGKCVGGILNMWTGGGMAVGTLLLSNGNQFGGFGTIIGNQIQITPLGAYDHPESGTLTISSDASSISGTISGNYCTHTISLKRIF
ncbi:MAG: hypothetical protein NVSMB63_13180 [Sediminibacterium sp.]